MFDFIQVDREIAVEGAKRLVIDSIWKSASIELVKGITFPETREIFEGRVPRDANVEKVIVVNNLKRAWQFLFENIDYPIDFQLVAEYNKIIGEGGLYSDPGKLRTGLVRISGTSYLPGIPSYDSVKEELAEAAALENPVDRALELFARSSRGQWFNNGNKRTAQMLANHALLQANVGVFAIAEEDQETFLEELIAYYDSANSLPLKQFLYETAVETLPSGIPLPQLRALEALQNTPKQKTIGGRSL